MILVVADTGPLHYLVIIEAIGVLPRLYDRVIIPSAVHAELMHPNAPVVVKTWAYALPSWAEIKSAAHDELDDVLDPGEAEAIILAEQLNADSLLLDEIEARREAFRRGLPVAGTIGVLEKAAERDLIDLKDTFARLARTNFHVSPELNSVTVGKNNTRHYDLNVQLPGTARAGRPRLRPGRSRSPGPGTPNIDSPLCF